MINEKQIEGIQGNSQEGVSKWMVAKKWIKLCRATGRANFGCNQMRGIYWNQSRFSKTAEFKNCQSLRNITKDFVGL